jgi:pyruvate/2-oxoglutarate dehydrogenase complex dihydrolipoamide dehydrogenase (E3) component
MTSSEDIFAIGDCASNRPSDTAVSYLAGLTLSKRLFRAPKYDEGMDYEQVVPKFLMTPVEYGCIGLSEEAAVKEYGEPNIQTYCSRFTPVQFQFYKNR